MKPVIAILLSSFLLFSVAGDSGFHEATFLISQKSELQIIGFTNVNSFTCTYDISQIESKQQVQYKKDGNQIVFNQTDLNLNSKAFDCGSRMINRDFNKMLQTDIYPIVSLKLVHVKPDKLDSRLVNAYVNVTICGKIVPYQVHVVTQETDQLSVKGVLKMNLKDFGLEPPKKALGLIEVCDDIDINFNLYFNEMK